MEDTTKMALGLGVGVAIAAGLAYATSSPASTTSTLPPEGGGSVPGLNPVGNGPQHVGTDTGVSVTQGSAYVLLFTSAAYEQLGTNWRASIANVLTQLGWNVHVNASTGSPSVANDTVDNGIANGDSGYTAIATWELSTGELFNSLDNPPVTYTQVRPTGKIVA